ncbi:PepSY-like domain-containing protein [Bacteroides sedimenti]|uniref:Putative beta-lactamase-inhibitor-like PepSY-like domain-containing protein n=1 Tax=Bacteroides sedimenti TaxID=2136147 RepID=A0ABM8IFW0_9BACE
MKKLTLMIMAVMIASFAFAQKEQKKNIPAQVEKTFQKQFPNATKVKWEKEGAKYEANFTLDKTEQSVLIDNTGKMVEVEAAIGINQLPKNILSYVTAHYPGKAIKEAAKITDSKGKVTYEAGIKGKDLIFDLNGNFIKESKE